MLFPPVFIKISNNGIQFILNTTKVLLSSLFDDHQLPVAGESSRKFLAKDIQAALFIFTKAVDLIVEIITWFAVNLQGRHLPLGALPLHNEHSAFPVTENIFTL